MMLHSRDLARRYFIGIVGLLIFIVAGLAVIDTGFFNNTLSWANWSGSSGTNMAVPTAICLLFSGMCFMIIALSNTLWKLK